MGRIWAGARWQKISAGRDELASCEQARAPFSADPSRNFWQFGVAPVGLGSPPVGGELSELVRPISAANPFHQEFGDIRGCASAVLGSVVVVLAGVGGAVGAAAWAAAANAAAANANYTWNTKWAIGCGAL